MLILHKYECAEGNLFSEFLVRLWHLFYKQTLRRPLCGVSAAGPLTWANHGSPGRERKVDLIEGLGSFLAEKSSRVLGIGYEGITTMP